MINNTKLRSTLLMGTVAVTAIALSSVASAADNQMETVVVTGTHIASANLTSTTPVLEATSKQIEVTGLTKMEEFLNKLPQVFAGTQNSAISNGATGTATVDLRGLGCDRTMVLVDGRRLPYGAPTEACADLNQIPNLLIDRVEVLTGGASAVYGSDAVAGVVNFITKQDFEGVKLDFQYSTYQHNNDYSGAGDVRNVIASRAASNPSQFSLPSDSVWDGAGKQFSALIGVNSANGKGNLTAYFTYRQNDKITENNRDYSACAITGVSGRSFTCGGSSTAFPGRFSDYGGNEYIDPVTKKDLNPLPSYNFTLDGNGGIRNFNSAQDQYNYAPTNYFQRPDERFSFGVNGHYDFNSHAKFYTQMMYTHYETTAQIAPSGDFNNTTTINCDNPLLTSAQYTAIGCGAPALAASQTINPDTGEAFLADPNQVPLYIGRRNVEGGPRQDSLRLASFRLVGGLRGEIVDGWTYDAYLSYSNVEMNETYLRDFSKSRMTKALDVVKTSNGSIACRSAVNGTDPDCVPYDIFNPGGVTQAALNYLQIPLLQSGNTTTTEFNVVFAGDLGQYGVKSPLAKDGVQVAFGADYRQDMLKWTTDVSYSSFDGAGQGGPQIGFSGATHVAEGFAEAKIPLVQDKYLIRDLNLETAYRFSSYDKIDSNTFKVAANWSVTDDVTFRFGYNRAVRAPNVIELYTAAGYNLSSDFETDPCGPNGYATKEACMRTPGAGNASWYGSASLDSPAQQYNYMQGGNRNLKAEKADTITAGIVLTPEFLPGLNVSVDYFNIKVYQAISSVGDVNTLSLCYKDNNAAACSRIHRLANGSLWLSGSYIDDRNTNIGGMKTDGVDFNGSYQMNLDDVGLNGGGSLAFSLNGTWLNHYTTDTGVGVVNRCVSAFSGSCGIPNPAWRHNFNIDWETPWNDMTVTWTWRFIGGTHTYQGDETQIDYHMAAQSYFDVSAAMPLLKGAELRIGVNNLFDYDPPLNHQVGTSGNGNTYPQLYDSFGRYLFTSLTVKL